MHICLAVVAAVHLVGLYKAYWLDIHVIPSILLSDPIHGVMIAAGLSLTSSAVVDVLAFSIILSLNTKASLRLATVLLASIGLHFAGFVGFRVEVMHTIYPFLAYWLLAIELFIVISGYLDERRASHSSRDFISLFNSRDKTGDQNSRKAGQA